MVTDVRGWVRCVLVLAGKSTLLDLLAYRKTTGFITGEYYVNGKPEKPSGKWCSYVTQDNIHIATFTVSRSSSPHTSGLDES